jgi:hypothetical protein
MGTLNFSGRTVAFNWTQGNADPVMYGDVTLTTTMTMVTVTGSPTWTFANQGTVQALNTAGLTLRLSTLTVNSPGGGVSLTTNTTVDLSPIVAPNVTGTFTLTAGTLSFNANTLTTVIFNTTASTARTIAFGTGKIVVTASTGTIFTYGTATNLTITGTSLVQCTNGGAGTRTITLATTGATEANSINFEITSGSDIVALGGSGGVAQNLNFTGFTGTIDIAAAKTIYGNFDVGSATSITGTSVITTFAATSGTKTIRTNSLVYGGSFTFNGVGGTWEMQDALTLTLTGTCTLTNGTLKLKSGTTNTVGAFATSGTNQKFLQSSTPGVQATLSDASGTVSVSYLTIQDSVATGGATWLAYVGNLNVDAGNNTGWVFFNNVYADAVVDSATVTDLTNVGVTFNATVADLATLLDSTSSAFLWNIIDDSQTPNWQNIDNDQLPGWQDIDTL